MKLAYLPPPASEPPGARGGVNVPVPRKMPQNRAGLKSAGSGHRNARTTQQPRTHDTPQHPRPNGRAPKMGRVGARSCRTVAKPPLKANGPLKWKASLRSLALPLWRSLALFLYLFLSLSLSLSVFVTC